MEKSYEKNKHKIRNNWDDIIKLIALEEELLKRLSKLEESISLLWRQYGKIEE